MNSFSQFFTIFLQPVFDLFTRLISLPIFGVPLYQILLSFFVLAFVIGFISSGTALGGGVFNAASSLARGSASAAASIKNRHVSGSSSDFDEVK